MNSNLIKAITDACNEAIHDDPDDGVCLDESGTQILVIKQLVDSAKETQDKLIEAAKELIEAWDGPQHRPLSEILEEQIETIRNLI